MTHPPPPGPTGGDDATRAFPAAGPPGPVAPGPAPAAPGSYGGHVPSSAPGSAGAATGPFSPGSATGPFSPGAPPSAPGGQGAQGAPSGWSSSPPQPGAPPPGHSANAAPTSRGRGQGRILGRAVVVLLVIGALAGTTAWGFVNRASAERWRDRSEAADADLQEALDRVEATSSDLEDARTRLRDLANENAGETDRNRILSEIVAQAPEVTEALADCQQLTTALANDIIAAFGAANPDATAFQDQADEVNDVCADALESAQGLEEAIEALGI